MLIGLLVTLALLALSVYGNIRMASMLLRIEDNMQKSLEYLDERYRAIDKLLRESNLIADDEIATQFVEEIKRSLNGILYAASVLRDPSADIEGMLEKVETDIEVPEIGEGKE